MVAGLALFVAAIWAALLFESTRARDRAVAGGGAVLTNLAVTLAAQIEATLLGIDQALIAMSDRIEQAGGHLDAVGATAGFPALRNLQVRIALVDRDGLMSGPITGPDDRAMAQRFAAHPAGEDRMAIAPPAGPLCNFLVSRRAPEGPDGSLRVLVASISTSHLFDLFSSVSLGGNGAVALIGADGVVWARAGSHDLSCGRRVENLEAMLAVHRVGNDLIEVSSPVDGVRRLVGLGRVPHQPLRVLVGMAMHDVLAPARHEALRYMIFGAVATVLAMMGGVLLARDMTKRQRMQAILGRVNQRLAASRRAVEARGQQLSAAVLHSREAISIFDADRRLVLSNHAHGRLMDYPPELQRPGTSALEHLRLMAMRGDFGPVEDPEAEASRRFHSLRFETRMQFERVLSDGRRIVYRRSITPDGSLVTLYRDVTEERRQMAELRQARRDAVEAAERKSELLAVVGHEIRTPMTGIVGFLQLLAGSGLTPEQQAHLDIAASSSRALLTLLDDLMTHSRIEAGRLQLELSDWQLETVLRDTWALFTPAAARRGVRISVRIQPDLPARVVTDGQRLRQILGNLVANAVRLTFAGEITIAADIVPGPRGAGAEPLAWIRISVRDQGPGVPDTEKAVIFEPYFQGRSAADSGEGTGLGLAICRRLVELFGGRIGVDDAPGGGAEFWFTIPLRAAAPVASVAASIPPAHRLRTLVVEDNPANQYLARRFLEHLGHQATIVPATDGAEASFAASGFDLIILDRRLSDGDGLDFLRWVRARGDGGRIGVIVVTAAVDDGAREAAMAAGADQFLRKPYAIEELAGAIALAWAARRG